jgi:hypothetical protein
MTNPAMLRAEAEQFCRANLVHLCNEVLAWVETGTLGTAPYFRSLSNQCGLYGGLEYGRKIAENMVRTEAMRAVLTKGT